MSKWKKNGTKRGGRKRKYTHNAEKRGLRRDNSKLVQDADRHDHHHHHHPHQDDFYYPNHVNTKKVFIILQFFISLYTIAKTGQKRRIWENIEAAAC